ncbi:hypothetical protein [Rhodoferax sp.]|uniref:hypothetical protein n=1 Tax=Rhodoferax sp. TaxID=50421 RepID=UPI0025DADC9E|nr:hypothetical protein [Rhodoferax sp.]
MRKVQVTSAAKRLQEAESITDSLVEKIMLRPDGYYWQAPDGKQEFGPFESLEMAMADMGAVDEQAPEPGETLQEAEDEIGIAGWIDPETGEPAEGQSPPRLEE